MIYEFFSKDGRVLEVHGSIKDPPRIGTKRRVGGVTYTRGFSILPPPKVKNWEFVAHSQPRMPGATREQLAKYGIPRVDHRGAPVFKTRQEVREYKAKNSGLKAGNVDYDGDL